MNAKVLNKLFLTCAIFMISLPMWGESEAPQSPPQAAKGGGVLILQSKHTDVKRMPSRNFMEVIYSDGFITIDSNYYEGNFSLRFENCESSECYEVSSIQVGESVPLALTYGEYHVKAEGISGILLSGYMEIF